MRQPQTAGRPFSVRSSVADGIAGVAQGALAVMLLTASPSITTIGLISLALLPKRVLKMAVQSFAGDDVADALSSTQGWSGTLANLSYVTSLISPQPDLLASQSVELLQPMSISTVNTFGISSSLLALSCFASAFKIVAAEHSHDFRDNLTSLTTENYTKMLQSIQADIATAEINYNEYVNISRWETIQAATVSINSALGKVIGSQHHFRGVDMDHLTNFFNVVVHAMEWKLRIHYLRAAGSLNEKELDQPKMIIKMIVKMAEHVYANYCLGSADQAMNDYLDNLNQEIMRIEKNRNMVGTKDRESCVFFYMHERKFFQDCVDNKLENLKNEEEIKCADSHQKKLREANLGVIFSGEAWLDRLSLGKLALSVVQNDIHFSEKNTAPVIKYMAKTAAVDDALNEIAALNMM